MCLQMYHLDIRGNDINIGQNGLLKQPDTPNFPASQCKNNTYQTARQNRYQTMCTRTSWAKENISKT